MYTWTGKHNIYFLFTDKKVIFRSILDKYWVTWCYKNTGNTNIQNTVRYTVVLSFKGQGVKQTGSTVKLFSFLHPAAGLVSSWSQCRGDGGSWSLLYHSTLYYGRNSCSAAHVVTWMMNVDSVSLHISIWHGSQIVNFVMYKFFL